MYNLTSLRDVFWRKALPIYLGRPLDKQRDFGLALERLELRLILANGVPLEGGVQDRLGIETVLRAYEDYFYAGRSPLLLTEAALQALVGWWSLGRRDQALEFLRSSRPHFPLGHASSLFHVVFNMARWYVYRMQGFPAQADGFLLSADDQFKALTGDQSRYPDALAYLALKPHVEPERYDLSGALPVPGNPQANVQPPAARPDIEQPAALPPGPFTQLLLPDKTGGPPDEGPSDAASGADAAPPDEIPLPIEAPFLVSPGVLQGAASMSAPFQSDSAYALSLELVWSSSFLVECGLGSSAADSAASQAQDAGPGGTYHSIEIDRVRLGEDDYNLLALDRDDCIARLSDLSEYALVTLDQVVDDAPPSGGAQLAPGDLALLRRTRTVAPGRLAVLQVDTGASFTYEARRVHDAAGLPADEMVNLLGVAAARLARSAPGAAPTSTQADTQPLVPLPAPTGPLADTQPLVPPTAPPGSPADPQPLAPGGAFPLLPGFLRLPLPSYTASGNGIEPGGTQDLDVHQARQGDRTLYVYTLSTRRWVSLSRAQDRLALAAATGRSMDRRGILPGDLVLLRLVVQYPMNRDIVAAQLHDDATATDLDDRLMLKQYIRSGDQYALIPQSTDPSYAARSFAISDPQVSILGDAVLLFSPHPPGLPA